VTEETLKSSENKSIKVDKISLKSYLEAIYQKMEQNPLFMEILVEGKKGL